MITVPFISKKGVVHYKIVSNDLPPYLYLNREKCYFRHQFRIRMIDSIWVYVIYTEHRELDHDLPDYYFYQVAWDTGAVDRYLLPTTVVKVQRRHDTFKSSESRFTCRLKSLVRNNVIKIKSSVCL